MKPARKMRGADSYGKTEGEVKPLILLVALFALTGCSKTPDADITICREKAIKEHPFPKVNYRDFSSYQNWLFAHDKLWYPMLYCMRDRGWEMDYHQPNCDSAFDTSIEASCYYRNDLQARIARRLGTDTKILFEIGWLP